MHDRACCAPKGLATMKNRRVPHNSREYERMPLKSDDTILNCDNAQVEQKQLLENYRTIFDAANDAILIHNADNGIILDVNRKMLEMYGYTKKEVLSLNIGALSEGNAPYTMEEARKNIERAAKGDLHVFEWKAKRKNGEIFWVEVSLRMAMLYGSNRIIAIVRDIDSRKKTEQEMKSQRDRFEFILEGTTAGTWEWNVQTGETFIQREMGKNYWL